MPDRERTRDLLREIFAAGIAAADPRRLLPMHARCADAAWSYDDGAARLLVPLPRRSGPGRVLVFGAGKAAASLALALERSLGDRLDGGCVVVKHGHREPLARVEQLEAAHPLPDESGVRATQRLLQASAALTAEDCVFVALTGGASSLLVAPAAGLALADKREATRRLMHAGATIGEINCVRRHLSAVKGGQWRLRLWPARVVTLLISDVVEGHVATIGSGPTVPDESTFAEALAIVDRYGQRAALPPAALRRLEAGADGRVPETPKPGERRFEGDAVLVLASGRHAVAAAAARATQLGFDARIHDPAMTGGTHVRAREFAARLVTESTAARARGARRVALVAGGETTLEVRGPGSGGRSQEFALVAAREFAGHPGLALLAGGTDGTDGPTEAAGGFADWTTEARAAAIGLDLGASLAANDSGTALAALDDRLVTGPTGTNVMDLVIGIDAAP